MFIKFEYLTRKTFEVCTKIIIKIQGVAIISGPTLLFFYGRKGFLKPFKGWKGYTTSRLDHMDAVIIYPKKEASCDARH